LTEPTALYSAVPRTTACMARWKSDSAQSQRGGPKATRSFHDDAAINIEDWLTRKAQDGIRKVTSQATATGSGIGMPLGLLHPGAGVPICDVGANTAAGTIARQDLVMLIFSVPVQYHNGASFVMNQRTLGMLLSISDANGRPVIVQDLTAPTKWTVLGFPVYLSEYWPDVACEIS
jgi:HK97 family phage major capsid protein